jgi:UDP-N-acetylglucosamine 2-epimerase (non-hydrolysing)
MFIVVTGTRPEIIKQSSIIRALTAAEKPFIWFHSGQHNTTDMTECLYEDLGIGRPHVSIEGSGSLSLGQRIQAIRYGLSATANSYGLPKAIIVQGDTATALAGALWGNDVGVPVAHIEAGLRCHDLRLPEESFRVIIDSISTFHYPPTEEAAQNLVSEGYDLSGITGNTVADTILYLSPNITPNRVVQFGVSPDNYFLVTLHRLENVEDKSRFTRIMYYLSGLSITYNVLFVAHPRTQRRLDEWEIPIRNVNILKPLSLVDFLSLEHCARGIITDSGGVQEEACILGTPCITIRKNTERPETISLGANELVDVDCLNRNDFYSLVLSLTKQSWPNPYGEGQTAKDILDHLEKTLEGSNAKEEEHRDEGSGAAGSDDSVGGEAV